MSEKQIPLSDLNLWSEFIEASNALTTKRANLFQQATNLVAIVDYGLSERHIGEALDLATMLQPDDLKIIFQKLLTGASYFNGYTQKFEQLVLSLPKEWLRENIEHYAEPILQQDASSEEFGRLLYFFYLIDADEETVIRLARRAIHHEDPDIQEIGHRTLARLKPD